MPSWTKDLTGYFVYLLLTATLGPLLYGYHLAELNAPQDVITCVKKSIGTTSFLNLPQCIPMDAAQIGLVSSMFTPGGLVGALTVGTIAAKRGRLFAMRITTTFFTLGPIGEALAPSVAVMAAGRFVSGLGAGAALVVVPIYIAEIAPPKEKGFFGAFTQIMTNMGIFVAQVLGYFLSHDQMWRLILAIGGMIGLAQLLGLTFAVESPKWLADHGEPRQAKQHLKKIRGHEADIGTEVDGWKSHSAHVANEEESSLLENADNVSESSTGPSKSTSLKKETLTIISVFRHPEYSRATLTVMVVMVAQQLCGINSIVMYGVSLLSGLLKSNSALLNIFVSLLNIVVTTGCAPLVDIWGRKPCLLSSIAGMGISSVLLGFGIRYAVPALSTIAVLTFVAAFGLGLGPVPYILSSELVGAEAVGATQSWALAANWISTGIIAQLFPVLNASLSKGFVYFIFAAFALIFFTFIAIWVPETKGKKNADEVWGRTQHQD